MFLWGKRWSALPPPETKPGGQIAAPPRSEAADDPPSAGLTSLDPSTSLIWLTLSFLHNISTPLSTLATVLDDLSPSLPDSTNQVLQATVRSLIQSTTLQSHSLRGNVVRQPLDLVQASIKITPLLRQICAPYTVILRCTTDQLLILGNSAAWEQILINLTLNSRQALRHQNCTTGSLSLTLEKKQGQAEITWRDSGSGIPADMWQKVLQPLTGNWKKDPHGYGLRSCRYWWERAFHGRIALRAKPEWSLVLQAPLVVSE